MFAKILIGLAVIVALFLAIASRQPDDFRYERSTTMAAPPAVIFAQVNNLENFNGWSPWAKMDPATKVAYTGPAEGKEAAMAWESNKTGSGKMTITESRPNEFIQFRLDFIRPFKATHTAEFTFKPEGNQTVVTWSMYGENNFIGKIMSLVMNCEKMMNETFDKGLADLKMLVERK